MIFYRNPSTPTYTNRCKTPKNSSKRNCERASNNNYDKNRGISSIEAFPNTWQRSGSRQSTTPHPMVTMSHRM
jgi:hypothetical protein